MSIRPVSIVHLVFGLVFLGITTLWVVGATTDVQAPALALWGPVVLIGAGVVGLAAIVFNSRTAAAGAKPDAEPATETEPEYATTATDEEHS
jgi:hypothetical protein